MSLIGITTTVPVEIILAAGHTPVDLNNIFIEKENASRLVEAAETAGYPRNICGWIKGLYAVVASSEKALNIDKVIAVTQGDCSNTHALMETYELAGIETIPFAYPFDRDYDLLKLQMEKLMQALGTSWPKVMAVKTAVDKIRTKIARLDALTWQENTVGGFDNHLWQVSCSDFNRDTVLFEKKLDGFLEKAAAAQPLTEPLRLGYMGVPPIFTDLYSYLEKMGARVVYNEVQRQFAMPFAPAMDDLVEQYRRYTYPYGIFRRLEDIEEQITTRNIAGMIHYVQSFCFRQIEDLIVRQKLTVPVLTIEGDNPGVLDARTRLRIDSFLEMIS
jgi:benzoyl-CoA reductase/2-hydroxyglutaryl-CoA dehydratase subunit BcrC/BadD/HgdB